MQVTDRDEQTLFQAETLRIARALWPQAEYGGAEIVDGRERDGVFETDECIHLLECTVSRSKDKADNDSKKLVALVKKYQTKHPEKIVKGWFVTQDEPTADQRGIVKANCNVKGANVIVTPISFAHFQSKLIDVSGYLGLRDIYPFGSVRDPATGNYQAEIEYLPLDVVDSVGARLWSIDDVCEDLLTGGRFVMLADYGSGKSMTLREIYRELRRRYHTRRTSRFPIYLNLRDHFGQTEPTEVLERHGRRVGFANPSHLVRAWRSGYVILLIDGFDELTTLGIQGLWKKLQEIRYRAMEVVRRFIREQPNGVGAVLTGRAHFFDSDKERRNALGIGYEFHELTLNEFNDEQIKRYLDKHRLSAVVPSWMPSRPLLVGYLASSGVLGQAASGGGSDLDLLSDPARGWDFVVDRVCSREAEIEAGIDGQTVRRILERLATKARRGQSGVGPLSREDVIAAFAEICGYQPDEKGVVLLQRLPGLGIDRAEEGTRVFLDEALADTCRAGDVSQFMSDPFNFTTEVFRGLDCGLGELGVGLSLIKAEKSGFSTGKMIPALQVGMKDAEYSALVLDLVRIAIEFGYPIQIPIQLREICVPYLLLHEHMQDCSRLCFQDCVFTSLSLDPGIAMDKLPRFESCYIDLLEGRSSRKDLPSGIFDAKCEFGRFSEAPETTNAISEMDLPLGTKVLLTVLRKIYFQSGSGRKENALHRGLDHHSRRLVSDVLRLLQSEKIVTPYRRAGLDMTIWIPDRSKTSRVTKLITSPRMCKDPLIAKAERL